MRKGFGERTLIEDLTFSLPPGGIVGIVGPNGAGKTTLIRMLMGEQKPDEGVLTIGESVNMICVDQSREALQGDKSVFEELSGGFDTLALGTQVHGIMCTASCARHARHGVWMGCGWGMDKAWGWHGGGSLHACGVAYGQT